jgi:hypothetical protein
VDERAVVAERRDAADEPLGSERGRDRAEAAVVAGLLDRDLEHAAALAGEEARLPARDLLGAGEVDETRQAEVGHEERRAVGRIGRQQAGRTVPRVEHEQRVEQRRESRRRELVRELEVPLHEGALERRHAHDRRLVARGGVEDEELAVDTGDLARRAGRGDVGREGPAVVGEQLARDDRAAEAVVDERVQRRRRRRAAGDVRGRVRPDLDRRPEPVVGLVVGGERRREGRPVGHDVALHQDASVRTAAATASAAGRGGDHRDGDPRPAAGRAREEDDGGDGGRGPRESAHVHFSTMTVWR